MHWSKRVVFLVTLLAFLSNMAFALPANTGFLKPNGNPDQKAQLEKHQDPALSWFAAEALEELEEAEFESDADLKASLTSDQWNLNRFVLTHYHNPHYYLAPTKYRPGAVTNWSWLKVPIIIYFQDFRI
ncbi:MAG: hypothetical protein ACKOGD_07225 [Sphingomonadales bacterium]